MARKKAEEHGNHIIVASEPSTYKKQDWTLIEKNYCIMVEKNGKVVVEAVEYPEEWNATVN
jgi:glutamine amidotransferase